MPTQVQDALATLLEVARENPTEREKLISILEMEPTRRKIAINILVTTMRNEKAPEDFLEAWDALQNDALAEQIKGMIRREEPSRSFFAFQGGKPGLNARDLLGTFVVTALIAAVGLLFLFLLSAF